ncbi:HAD domain-containing protein [Promicromonospora panici]|uniref:HAD domain-containing protein n=1 Tax=Promicromonospora panici TaxID=2219658 RepID=UPI00101C3503|nr:HAD domain-containing protein [Promicromonospora panici]
MLAAPRPILFLDVDGTLLPFGGPGMPVVPDAPGVWTASSNPYLARIDRSLGPLLTGLGCDLVWATAWMDDANEVIAPLLGLPRLPVADLPAYDGDIADDRLQWKTKALVRIAEGRPFVWVDDVIGEADRWFVELEHPGAALLHKVGSDVGITTDDLAVIERWLRALRR